MGDIILDEMRSRNRMYIICVILLIILATATALVFKLSPEKESSKINEEETSSQSKVQEEERIKNSNNSSSNITSNVWPPLEETVENETIQEKVIDQYDYPIKNVKGLNLSACGAPPAKLFEWFGVPLNEMGWVLDSSGKRIEAHSFKFFVWNSSVVYTKGRFNNETKSIETYEYLSRSDTNRTVEVHVECNNNS